MQTITGKVVYVNLSGGFWGIEGNQGEKLTPANSLPSGFQQDGLKVRVSYKPSSAFSIHMWGQNIDIVNIEKG